MAVSKNHVPRPERGRDYLVTVDDESAHVKLSELTDGYEIKIDDKTYLVDSRKLRGTNVRSLLIDDVSYEANVRETGPGTYDVFVEGEQHEAEVQDHFAALARKSSSAQRRAAEEKVASPMPGLVVSVEVSQGDVIDAGRPVAIVEAMKMQNEIASKYGGRVQEIKVRDGDVVDSGQVLVVLKPEDAE